ncbi:MAG: hypothetical protein ABF380_12915 [Akkermansiaceae bacterium]
MERFQILAGDIDQLRNCIEQLSGEQSVDDLLEVLEVETLGEQFGVSLNAMKRRLNNLGGQVFKMGRKYVIRKIKFLEVVESLERE